MSICYFNHCQPLILTFTNADEITLNGKIIEDEVRSMEVSNKVSISGKRATIKTIYGRKAKAIG